MSHLIRRVLAKPHLILDEMCRLYRKFASYFSSYKWPCYLFCCSKCGPRLSEEAAQMLKNRYVLMRSGARDYERDAEKKINIPITVR